MGTRMIANMDLLFRGWIRWDDNKPAEHIMGLVAEGFVPPKRNTLGWGYELTTKKEDDADKRDWQLDEDSGQYRDPWQQTWYLPMRELDPEGKPLVGEGLFTFVASSTGGKDAVTELCGVFGKAMRFHPDEFPVVTLGYSKYKHSNPKFGIIKTPELVIGFINSEQARKGTKSKLFNVQKDWIAKDMFGEIEMTAPDETSEDDGKGDIPF